MKYGKLITESNYSISIEENKEKSLYITGLFSSAEKKNENGRIYPKEILQREVDMLSESINNKSCYGEAGHPTSRAETSPERIAIMVEDLSWKGNDLYGKAKVLQRTLHGSQIAGVIQEGGRLGISSRGLGTVNEETNEVNEDFKLITYDVVTAPSNYGSWVNGVLESQKFPIPEQNNDLQVSYQDIKKFLIENSFNYDPMRVQELVKEGYDLDYIKDLLTRAQEEHARRIYQVLESLK